MAAAPGAEPVHAAVPDRSHGDGLASAQMGTVVRSAEHATEHAIDRRWMRRALALARRREGLTAPNPLVGAVVVRGDTMFGSGYHRGPGTPHAEVHALVEAGAAARGATLYVTLEPCVHTFKRTPPCVPDVIAAGISRVVAAMADPNPSVSGGGFDALRVAGIAVDVGCLEADARHLNAPYLHALATGLPWLTLKIAQTLDGKVATARGESRWITGAAARAYGHRLRHINDVILVGAGTVRTDNPELTCRRRGGRNPVRVVVDGRLTTPPDARVLTAPGRAPTILVASGANGSVRDVLADAGARVWDCPADTQAHAGTAAGRADWVNLEAMLRALVREGHHRVLCEGGPTLAASLLRGGWVQRIACFVAPMILGGDDARGSVGGCSPPRLLDAVSLTPFRVRRLGNDLLLEADVMELNKPAQAGSGKEDT